MRSSNPEWLVWRWDGRPIEVVDVAHDDLLRTHRTFAGRISYSASPSAMAPNHQRLLVRLDGQRQVLDLSAEGDVRFDVNSETPTIRWTASSERLLLIHDSFYGQVSFTTLDGSMSPTVSVSNPNETLALSPSEDLFSICGRPLAVYDMREGPGAARQEVELSDFGHTCTWSPNGDAIAVDNPLTIVPIVAGSMGAPIPVSSGEPGHRASWLGGSHVLHLSSSGLAAVAWNGTSPGAESILTTETGIRNFAPIPNGKGVVYTVAEGAAPADYYAVLLEADTFGPPQVVTTQMPDISETTAFDELSRVRMAPDGSILAFRDMTGQLVVVSFLGATATTTVVTQHVTDHDRRGDFEFSPDSKWLLYRTAEGLNLFPIASGLTGGLVHLVPETDNITTRWSEKGRLAFVVDSGDATLYLLDPAQPDATPIVLSSGTYSNRPADLTF